MNNLNLLCQTIRFQRTALQNSLAMISAVQRHGENLLKTTLDQSPWIPGQGRDAVMFWAGIWRKSLVGATDMVDTNLATMERFASPAGEKQAETPAESAGDAAERPQRSASATHETKQESGKAPAEATAPPPPVKAQPIAMVKTEAEKPQAAPAAGTKEQPPARQPVKKKTAEPES